MFEQAEKDQACREQWMGHGASPLLYYLLNRLVDYCFPIVHKVVNNVHHIEENLFSNDVQHLLHEVAIQRRDIIVLRSIFRSQQNNIQALIQGNWSFIQEELDPYWGDIGDHLAQLCMIMEQYAQVIDGLSDTLDTLASHRIDEVVRLLTITTVLTLPVTLLATVFGMNVVMPGAEHPVLFFSIVILGILLTVGLVWYLRNKRWL
jgi:magnesium transporter